MTREEAIQEFQNVKDLIRQDGKDWFDERDLELIDMAIEALSEETIEIKPIEIKGDFHIDDCIYCSPKIVGNVEVVVRCKDCRFAMVRTEAEMDKPIKPQPILCEWFCIGVENDDYCSYGERREK